MKLKKKEWRRTKKKKKEEKQLKETGQRRKLFALAWEKEEEKITENYSLKKRIDDNLGGL